MNGLNRFKDVYVETQDILSSRVHECIGCETRNIRARQGRALKKIWNLVAKDLWIVLLDVIAVNVSYFLALLVRFFDNVELVSRKVALKIAQLAIDAALNDHIGYDQSQNRTYLAQLKAVGWEPSRITIDCEADCSAGVCANVTATGHLLGIKALQNHTGTYTGNMRNALTKAGFQLLTESKYLTSGDYLLPGDILLNDGAHTATNVTIGKKVKRDWNPGTVAT